ncbi:MAG TPA: DUF188 domain-containing protein [Bacillota bacterium]|nr:DUF188 domain-containing protein [Bacillota bacterium]
MDADACPRNCLQIIQKFADTYHYQVVTVASFNHRINNPIHLVVGDEAQAADITVVNRTQPGDIVITQDWGLAAIVLAKQAQALSPQGRIFEPDQMDSLLEERHLLAEYRRSGGRTKGPAKRTRNDDERFLESFQKVLSRRTPAARPGATPIL